MVLQSHKLAILRQAATSDTSGYSPSLEYPAEPLQQVRPICKIGRGMLVTALVEDAGPLSASNDSGRYV